MIETRRHRRLRNRLRATIAGIRSPYQLDPSHEAAIVALLVRIEVEAALREKRKRRGVRV